MRRFPWANVVLAALIVGPMVALTRDGDRSLIILLEAIIAILVFFTFLTRRLLRKGLPSAPELFGRTMTFWWMLAAFLIALTTPPLCSLLVVGLLCGMSLIEYFALDPRGSRNLAHDRWIRAIALATVPAALGFAFVGNFAAFATVPLAFALLAMPITQVLQNRTEGTVGELGFFTLGVVFFVVGLGHGYFLLRVSPFLLLFCFFITEFRDLSSYWIGKALFQAWNRRPNGAILTALNIKIAPRVSPNKAWGAGLISVALSACLAAWMSDLLPTLPGGKMTMTEVALLGAGLGFFGLMGDLVFSMVKRDFHVKDSGSILPGGTGVIDRIDSLVLTIPVMFHALYWRFL